MEARAASTHVSLQYSLSGWSDHEEKEEREEERGASFLLKSSKNKYGKGYVKDKTLHMDMGNFTKLLLTNVHFPSPKCGSVKSKA